MAFAYGKAAEIMERTYNINNGMDPDTVTPINPYDLDLMYDHKFSSVHSADSFFFLEYAGELRIFVLIEKE